MATRAGVRGGADRIMVNLEEISIRLDKWLSSNTGEDTLLTRDLPALLGVVREAQWIISTGFNPIEREAEYGAWVKRAKSLLKEIV
jgi:hypothetical protein